MRPRVNTQWGKHGSMPPGWEQLQIVANGGDIERNTDVGPPISLEDYNRGTWRKLQTEGRRQIEHPMARRLGWPERFAGDWKQFVDFSRAVDLLTLIDRRRMVSVSRWNSAVINQHFLAYNFRPKTEWPTGAAAPVRSAPAPTSPAIISSSSLETFQLPAKTVFDKAMPLLSQRLVLRGRVARKHPYEAAVPRLVADEIRGPMRLL